MRRRQMISSLSSMPSSVRIAKMRAFIINDKNIALLRQLKDNNGVYMWQPSVQVGEPDTFLGYKLYTSQFAPTNAIAFGDYRYLQHR